MPEATPGKKPRVCAKCDKEGAKFVCSQCKQTYYCSQECQTSHWPKHYRQCVKLKAPASAGGKHKESGTTSATTPASQTEKRALTDRDIGPPGPSAAAALAMSATGTESGASGKTQGIVDTPERTPSGRKKYSCSNCQKIGAKFICTACRQRHYCNAECQNAHWQNGHKQECKEYQAKMKGNAATPSGTSGGSTGQEAASPVQPAVVNGQDPRPVRGSQPSPQPAPTSSLQSSLLYDGPERADHDSGYPLQPQSPARPSNGYVDEEPDTPVTSQTAAGGDGAVGARGEWDPATPVWGAGPSPQQQLYQQQHHLHAASGLRQPAAHRTPGTAHKAIRRPNRGVKVSAPPRTRDAIEKLEQVREEYFRNRATETDILHPLSGADLQEHNKLGEREEDRGHAPYVDHEVEGGRDRVGSTPIRAQRMPLRTLGRQESAPVFPADRRRSSNTPSGMSSGANGPFGLIDIFNQSVSPQEKKASMDLVEERLRTLVERLDAQCNVVQTRGLRSASETAEARQFIARMSACVAEMQSELLAVAAGLARRHPDDADLLAPFLSRDAGNGNGSAHTSPVAERKRGKGKGKGKGGKGKGKGKRHSPKLLPGARAAWT